MFLIRYTVAMAAVMHAATAFNVGDEAMAQMEGYDFEQEEIAEWLGQLEEHIDAAGTQCNIGVNSSLTDYFDQVK